MIDRTVREALAEALQQARQLDGPVNERLQTYVDALRRLYPPYSEAVDRLVARLNEARAGSAAPSIGDTMPEFLLPDETGRLVGLAEVLAEGPAAIAFHRGHWCPYCRINAHALAAAYMSARESGGQILAITPERQSYTKLQKAEAGADFRILSDIDSGYALSLGLAIWVGVEMQSVMSDFGRDLALYQGNASWFLPIPATFVVGRDGIVRARFVDPDYRRRMDIDALLTALAEAD